jgi:broad specificity phosphatase PhoE
MSDIVAVRHGQASFGEHDYDVLSALGRRQAQRLGSWLVAHGAAFEGVVRGAMLRHRDTLATIAESYAAAGLTLPAATVLEGLNEFDHRGVLAAFARAAPGHPAIVAAAAGQSSDLRAVYQFLRSGLHAWASGALDQHGAEPWTAFRARVAGAATEIERLARGGGRVLVVTSGGVMSQLAQHALGLSDARAVELNLSIRNSALAEFRVSDDGWLLGSWNALPHLAAAEDRAMWTYY